MSRHGSDLGLRCNYSVAEATTLASFKSQVSKEPLQRLLPCLFPAGSEAP